MFSFSLFLIDNQIHASAALIAQLYVWVTMSDWCVLFWESLFQDSWWFLLIPATAGWKREAAWLTGLIHIIMYHIVPQYLGLASELQLYNNLLIGKTLSLIDYMIMEKLMSFQPEYSFRHVQILTISRNQTFLVIKFSHSFHSNNGHNKFFKKNSVEYLVAGLIFYHVLI